MPQRHADDDESAATYTRRELFTSQLARKHPVAFFQFLDICARSEQLQPLLNIVPLLQLFQNGSSRIGTRGLAELLSSPAATAALGSTLASITKLCVRQSRRYGAPKTAPETAEDGEECSEEGDDLPTAFYIMGAGVLLPVLAHFGKLLLPAIEAASSSSSVSGGSSSSSGDQARASAVFLTVLIARGLAALGAPFAELPGAAAAGLI